MKLSSLIFYFLFFILISCKKEKTNNITTKEITQEEEKEEKINSEQSIIHLNIIAKQVVKNWQEYQNVAEFIPKYYKTTTKESLFNSQRLVELTQQLKDTIRVKNFDKPSFRTRLNVLNNEALRLADMDSISSITNLEIIQENKNIINAFEAIKAKINTLVNKEKLENDLKEFDYLFVNKDTIEEKTNKKTTLKKRKENLNRKKFNKRIQPIN
ncbi:MAG: hypothetical protein L3J23_08690 [Flavobacteriaceae bacterium]|nr:hypothetical protein [Flavobacteriaceae bacterium]